MRLIGLSEESREDGFTIVKHIELNEHALIPQGT